ncbi:MAG: radical SAM protein [Thermovirgaceae bacterium]|nr:radical SAM protein [Thermovirgaceae bacterium]
MRVKNIFTDESGRKTMEINVLPSKYCTFGCVFCPLGHDGRIKTDKAFHFSETDGFLLSLSEQIDREKPDVLFINSMGEPFSNDQLEDFINLAKSKNIKVSLYSNGYLLGNPEYARLASLCDEVSCEIKAVDEASFQKFQRPLEGCTLEQYLDNMAGFRKNYKGEFVAYICLVKGMNDDPKCVARIRENLSRVNPDRVIVETVTDEKLGKSFGVSSDCLEEMQRAILKD